MHSNADPAPRRCLVCGGESLHQFLDLGETALANRFLGPEELGAPEPSYPLRLAFCPDCTHVQLMDRVPPEAMFTNYLYVSSASETLKRHFDELSATLVARMRPGPEDLTVDIGCNDGTLLAAFRRNAPGGIRTLGVDPAENLDAFTRELGIERYTGLFTEATARTIRERWGPARIVTATNTFPHIQDLHDFARGIPYFHFARVVRRRVEIGVRTVREFHQQQLAVGRGRGARDILRIWSVNSGSSAFAGTYQVVARPSHAGRLGAQWIGFIHGSACVEFSGVAL